MTKAELKRFRELQGLDSGVEEESDDKFELLLEDNRPEHYEHEYGIEPWSEF